MERIGVVGTTSWGTTLAIVLARQGHQVSLWARTEDEAEALSRARENHRLLPGIPIPPSVHITADAAVALGNAALVIFAVPSRNLRENVRRVRHVLAPQAIVLSAVKGLEKETGQRMSQVLEEELPENLRQRIVVLSGPNLSREIAQEMPSTTVVASADEELARWVQGVVNTPALRVYTGSDVLGVELGGALKNIIAIGAGVSDGLGYGANVKAAFITRGLAEITRLGVAAGASPLTFAGIAGLGDLVATCFSHLSRNRHVGEQLGKGQPLEQVLAAMPYVAEGVDTTPAALLLAGRYGVEMPIAQLTYAVLFEGMGPRQAAAELMSRAPGPEWPTNLGQGREFIA